MLRTHFFFLLKILMISHIIRPNTITSPNTANRLPPAIIAAISAVIAIAMITLSKIINKIIMFTPFIILSVIFANQINFLSKHVSHRSLGKGFILNPNIICLIVTVGYSSLAHSPERSLKKTSKFLYRYNSSTNHGSILPPACCFISRVISLLYNSQAIFMYFEQCTFRVYWMITPICGFIQ